MAEQHADPLRLLEFPSLTELDGLVHAVSTRSGGVSEGRYASLNLGLHVGDRPDAVLENRRRFCRALGVDPSAVVTAAQTFGNAVAWVTRGDRGRGATDPQTALPHTDAIITDSPGVPLLAFSADCPLVAIVDPRRPAIGLAHASRLGTLGRVASRTVAAMQRLLGSDPAELRAAVAPSIGPCCYEVGSEVLAETRARLPGIERFLTRRGGRLHMDLWGANVHQLVQAGLREANIGVCGICTRCRADEFFSHRAAGGLTGRFGLLLALGDRGEVSQAKREQSR